MGLYVISRSISLNGQYDICTPSYYHIIGIVSFLLSLILWYKQYLSLYSYIISVSLHFVDKGWLLPISLLLLYHFGNKIIFVYICFVYVHVIWFLCCSPLIGCMQPESICGSYLVLLCGQKDITYRARVSAVGVGYGLVVSRRNCCCLINLFSTTYCQIFIWNVHRSNVGLSNWPHAFLNLFDINFVVKFL